MEMRQWVQCTLLWSYKYFVLLLKILSVQYYECASVFLPSLSGIQITPFLRVICVASPALHIFPIIS